jgi:hypothetical protein
VVKKISEPNQNEVTGNLEKLHKQKLHFYSSPNIIRMATSCRMRWRVARMGEDRNEHRVLVGKPERNSSPGRGRRRGI